MILGIFVSESIKKCLCRVLSVVYVFEVSLFLLIFLRIRPYTWFFGASEQGVSPWPDLTWPVHSTDTSRYVDYIFMYKLWILTHTRTRTRDTHKLTYTSKHTHAHSKRDFIHTYIYTYRLSLTSIHTHICTNIHTYIHWHTDIYICMHVCTNMHMYVRE